MSASLVIRMGRGCKADLAEPGRKGFQAATAMMALALIFSGILAMGLEQRAEGRQPIDDRYRLPGRAEALTLGVFRREK